MADKTAINTIEYRVTGMDCTSCATKIENASKDKAGVESVRVSIASQIMTLMVREPETTLPPVEKAIAALGYKLARVDAAADSDDMPLEAAYLTSSYRRALWIVVLLNVGYGLIEIVAGYISESQALKADALDFFGDGLITFLGLIAIGWGLVWRARSAMIQGTFLGLLGIAVVMNTVYRIFVQQTPDYELMGVFGLVALVVNVLAAAVLMPHREGDANVRAVWLFSRNDAIGNAAVVVAAILVAWTDTPWPDLVVAGVVASLFLHSSLSIIRHSRQDLEVVKETAK